MPPVPVAIEFLMDHDDWCVDKGFRNGFLLTLNRRNDRGENLLLWIF